MKHLTRSLVVAALIAVSGPALAGNGGVASDPSLLPLPSPPFPAGGPGNSVAATTDGGDANCLGDIVSGAQPVDEPNTDPRTGGTPTTAISTVFTVGTIGTVLPGFDCSNPAP